MSLILVIRIAVIIGIMGVVMGAMEVYKTPATAAEGQIGICLDDDCTQVLSLEIVPKHTTFLISPLHDLLSKMGDSEEESSSNTGDAKEWFFTKVT